MNTCKICDYGQLNETLEKSIKKDVGIYTFIYKTWKTFCNKCNYSKYNVTSERDFSGYKKHHEECHGSCLIHKEKNCICWCHETVGTK